MTERAKDPTTEDIPYGRQCIDESDIQTVVEVLRSDFITQGPRTAQFEDALKELTGCQYAVLVSSGTAALHLTALGLGLGEKDHGIVPAITFAATANCLRYVGAGVQFCDTDPVSGLSTVSHFKGAMKQADSREDNVKALFPVSMAGRVGGLAGLRKLADSCNAFVVEDAAHSIGATYTDSLGSVYSSGSCAHTDAAIFSFHPVKHICAGEGGAILTNDATLAKRARALRSHGIEPVMTNGRRDRWKYAQFELGLNYRATEMQAALALSQLGKLPDFIERRRSIATAYFEAFKDEAFTGIVSTEQPEGGSAWHLYVVHFLNSDTRERAYDFLHENGIRAQVHYMSVYHHPYYSGVDSSKFPGAEEYYSTCLSLPIYPSMTQTDQVRVIDTVKAFCAKERTR